MTATVRPATVDDADGIGAVHLGSWKETYAGLLSPEFFAAREVSRFQANWRRQLSEGLDVVVAEVDGRVVGFSATMPSRDDPPVRPLELAMIYLLAAQHGSGLGQALLDAAVGDRPASLWVAEQNPRAIAFYRRNGFAADGTRQVLESWEGLAEIRLVR
jgi:ribosomal protein S18 acetylase RimI-like enzyme